MDELFGFEEKVKPIIESQLREMEGFDASFKFHLIGIRDLEYLVALLLNTDTTIRQFFIAKQNEGYYKSVSDFIADHFEYSPNNISFLQERHLQLYRSFYSTSS